MVRSDQCNNLGLITQTLWEVAKNTFGGNNSSLHLASWSVSTPPLIWPMTRLGANISFNLDQTTAAEELTIGDSTSLLTTYRAIVNLVTTKINPTLVPPGWCNFNFYLDRQPRPASFYLQLISPIQPNWLWHHSKLT